MVCGGRVRQFISILLVVGAMSSALSPASASAAGVVLRPPTDTEIVSRFSLPEGQFGPGNRGLDYNTSQGDPLVASAKGIVIFAGAVAGSLHITVDHGGGLLTSYSYVDRILVRKGEIVDAGDPIALSGIGFHFGMRLDGRYVDPETMFGVRSVEVSLLPHPEPGRRAAWIDIRERSERIEFLELERIRSGGGRFGVLAGLVRTAGSFAWSPLRWIDAPAVLSGLIDSAWMLVVLADELNWDTLVRRSALIVYEAVRPRECTESGVVVGSPPERRIAIVVDGLNSSSATEGAMAQLDLGSHGYDRADIIRFSYAGGRVPDGSDPNIGGAAGEITSSTYTKADTRGSVADNVDDLAALLREVSALNPGVTIDVYGHSLGGLLTRLAVAEVVGKGGGVRIGVALTIAAPNHGVPISEVFQAAEMSTTVTAIVSTVEVVAPDSMIAADAIDDLSPSGYAGTTSDVAFPQGVHAVSIGASGDLVVPGSTTAAKGAENVVIDVPVGLHVHGDMPGYDEVDREVSLALADLPSACVGRFKRLVTGAKAFGVEQLERAGAGLVAGGVIISTIG